MIYEVYYDDVLIGEYEQNKKYTVFAEGIETLKARGIDVFPIIRKEEERTFPFFNRRIRNCSRFPGRKIGYHTDPVELRPKSS